MSFIEDIIGQPQQDNPIPVTMALGLKAKRPSAGLPTPSRASPPLSSPLQRQGQQTDFHGIEDEDYLRQNIYDKVKKAVVGRFPVENERYRIELDAVDYKGPDTFSKAEQKEALLKQRSLNRKLYGTWKMVDKKTGKVIDKRQELVAHVPFLTQRGTFIRSGNEYTVANQSRLKSGAYVMRRQTGEVQTQFNVTDGGRSFRLNLDPTTAEFTMQVGGAKLNLFPVLRELGVSNEDLLKTFGREEYARNNVTDDSAKRAHVQFHSDRYENNLAKTFAAARLSPDVTEMTLGTPYSNVTGAALLAAAGKMLRVSKGGAEEDNRDAIHFQKILPPDDLLAERVARDARNLSGGKLLWRSTFKNKLATHPGYLTPQIESVFLQSGLAQPGEETNPIETVDQHYRLLRTGEGGIDPEKVTMESRSVQPSHFGFVDPVRIPESMGIGVDSRLTINTLRGSDGNLYMRVKDRRGHLFPLGVKEAANSVIAFPGSLKNDGRRVRAMVRGKMDYIDRRYVDFELAHPTHMFTVGTNLIPMVSAVSGNRALMGARFMSQALPLEQGEAPLVQALTDDDETTFESVYGTKSGAVRSIGNGVVTKVTPHEIRVQTYKGVQKYELYNNFPMNRKTFIHNTPLIKVGDRVKDGQTLAKSNFTDQNGDLAMGRNLRTAYIAWKGKNYEDAVVISESAAQKLKSEHMYSVKLDHDVATQRNKRSFLSLYPGTFSKEQLDKVDDDGIIRPGKILHTGDPLVLAVRQKPVTELHRGHKPGWMDASETWNHDSDGIVTDVEPTKYGVRLSVRSFEPMRVGDKCFDDQTEVLTRLGWRLFKDLDLSDEIASLSETGELEYVQIHRLIAYHYSGKMYRLASQQVDFLVTPNHNQYVKPRYTEKFELVEARAIFGKRVQYKKNAEHWEGVAGDVVRFPTLKVIAGQSGNGERWIPELSMPVETYLMLLGAFLSEGSVFWHEDSGSFGIDIHQLNRNGRKRFLRALRETGLNFCERPDRFKIYGKQLAVHFKQFGKSAKKFIPSFVFDYSKEQLKILFDWLMWGDGAYVNGLPVAYYTVSEHLRDDMQRLCLHIGYGSNWHCDRPAERQIIKGKAYDCKPYYSVRIVSTKTEPMINHGHVHRQHAQIEEWQDYDGSVYCAELAANHVLFVRRNGKAAWSGNCVGRYGDKGTVSEIIPDSQMPRDSQGRPMELLLNPMGVVTRQNPAQLMEAVLGKIAEKTGKPVKMPHFMKDSIVDHVIREARKHGVTDTEDLQDADSERTYKGILTGPRFVMKLHHMAEHKLSGRDIGGYTSESQPARVGGEESAKRLSLQDLNALISHGAIETLKDAKILRGQQNDEYWKAFQMGRTPPSPEVPFIYRKFLSHLVGSGINIKKSGANQMQIMALTDKDIDKLSRGEIKLARGVEMSTMREFPGGLFDKGITGGHHGLNWSHVTLAEPIPNPVMEEPIRRLLGLTQAGYEDVLSGKTPLFGKVGGPAVLEALKRIDLKGLRRQTQVILDSGARSKRDSAVKLMNYINMFEKTGIKPAELVLTKVPVIPPVFRPISATSDFIIKSDANSLYVDVIKANDALKDMKKNKFKDPELTDERLTLYKSFKAVTGLGDPINPKLVNQRVEGLLGQVFGPGSPKFGLFQRRVLGGTLDTIGRAVITPNSTLDMDHVGLPEKKAWVLYKPFLIRMMVRRGMKPLDALRHVREQDEVAHRTLLEAMNERPVLISRAPVLHKYNIMASMPILTKGSTLQVSPLITMGFNADFDGDAMNFSLPVSDEAAREAKDKLLPSKNLFAIRNFDVHYMPTQEFQHGLFLASRKANGKKLSKSFLTKAEAVQAYRRGEIDIDTPIFVKEMK